MFECIPTVLSISPVLDVEIAFKIGEHPSLSFSQAAAVFEFAKRPRILQCTCRILQQQIRKAKSYSKQHIGATYLLIIKFRIIEYTHNNLPGTWRVCVFESSGSRAYPNYNWNLYQKISNKHSFTFVYASVYSSALHRVTSTQVKLIYLEQVRTVCVCVWSIIECKLF